MPGFKCFEEIPVWTEARELVGLVYRMTARGPFCRDFGLRDQVRRAAVSVMSNIAEGFESQSDRHFISYLCRARGSAAEARCQLYIAMDQLYITKGEFDQAFRKSSEISRMLTGFITYLQSTRASMKRRGRI